MSKTCLSDISQSRYWLLGPIQDNQPFYLAYEDSKNKVLYTLTYLPGANNTIGSLIFSPIANQTPIQLTATSVTGGYNFSFQYNKETLYISKLGLEFAPSRKADILIPLNSAFDDWAPFLAGVKYTMDDTENDIITWVSYVAAGPITNGRSNNVVLNFFEFEQFQVYAIPVAIFECGKCNENSGRGTTDPDLPLEVEGCWVSGGYSGSKPATGCPVIPESFTNYDDCIDNVWYKYCANNVECSAGCKGGCSNGLDCILNDNGDFMCQQPIPPPEPFYSQPWFLGAMIGFVILLIIFFILLFIFLK